MVVFKFIVSTCIIAGCSYIGIYKSKELKKREYILRDMVTFLNLVQNEIKYMLSILPNAYEASRQKLITSLKVKLGLIVNDMLNLENEYLIDQSIVKNISDIKEITDYDKNVFISTLKNLGRTDLEGQMNIIENGINIIQNQIQEANEISKKNCKLYKTVGTIAGIMIVIICI